MTSPAFVFQTSAGQAGSLPSGRMTFQVVSEASSRSIVQQCFLSK